MMADSPSLWNRSSAPGWSAEERDILRMAVMKFGIGKWREIIDQNCLPGKTPSQLNLQVQRLMGQQSLRDFMGLHVDPMQVFNDNALKEGFRKNGCLINMGNNPKPEERLANIQANKKKYGLTKDVIDGLQLPSFPAGATKPTDKPTDRPRPQKKDKKGKKSAEPEVLLRLDPAHVDAALSKLKRLESLLMYMEERLKDMRGNGDDSDSNDSPTSDIAPPPKSKPKPKVERRESVGQRKRPARRSAFAADFYTDDYDDFQITPPPGFSIDDFDGFVEPVASSKRQSSSSSKRRRTAELSDDEVVFVESSESDYDDDFQDDYSPKKSKGKKSRGKSSFF
eukprot:TRINITY_DN10934_c0_g1_i2.p1 TRINITY_DN10934_c0_g1~~TRINITY_DN10934_c0_g1_i2.p1  ORF type:complete len:338 (+),score=89.80 TRINITY_DN10934_c0_g1_i2:149-1162(+)